jgi:hypothetical protein
VRGVRALLPSDLPSVAGLYERVVRSGSRDPAPGLADCFTRTLLEHPWVDPDIPSLVYEDAPHRIAGFLGSHVRRLWWRGRRARLACSGQLVTDPLASPPAVGAFLLQRYLSGPQDATITDGATETVRRMWEGLAGHTSDLRSVVWMRIFRPGAAIRDGMRERIARARLRSGAFLRQAPLPGDGMGRLLGPIPRSIEGALLGMRGGPARPASAFASEPLQPRVAAQVWPDMAEPFACRPDYDEAFLEWLFREMAATTARGELVARLVREPNGRPGGWFVYYLKEGGISQTLQVVARPRSLSAVLDHLFHHAWTGGAAGLSGRLEPGLLSGIRARRCSLHFGEPALVHSRSEDLLGDITSHRSLLTRMDGEWWMGHHLHPLPTRP